MLSRRNRVHFHRGGTLVARSAALASNTPERIRTSNLRFRRRHLGPCHLSVNPNAAKLISFAGHSQAFAWRYQDSPIFAVALPESGRLPAARAEVVTTRQLAAKRRSEIPSPTAGSTFRMQAHARVGWLIPPRWPREN
jgi:hypothetical protein